MDVEIDIHPKAFVQPNAQVKKSTPRVFHPAQLEGWIIFIDCLAVALAYIMSFAISTFVNATESPHIITMVGGTIIITTMNRAFNLYNFGSFSNKAREIRLITTSITLAFLAVSGIYFSYLGDIRFSRTWFISWYLLSLLSVLWCRRIYWHVLQRMASEGKLRRRVALVGAGAQADRLLQNIQQRGEPWIEIVGVFDDRTVSRATSLTVGPQNGHTEQLRELCRRNGVDDVIIALPWSADQRILNIIGQLADFPVNVRTAPDLINFTFPTLDLHTFSGMAMLDVTPHPLNGPWAIVKLIEDYIVAGVLAVLLAPVMLVIAAAVKFTSPGPVIYRQARHGLNNRVFKVFKFRTMYTDQCSVSKTLQARKGDPRVTRVGAVLRRTSLDELPQLFNVLLGTMSMVGPRPHAVDQNEMYGDVIDRYFVRHRVKPGITGWAQVNGFRGETETPEKMQKRIEYDISYIENWSPFLDIIIIVKTGLVVFFQKAY